LKMARRPRQVPAREPLSIAKIRAARYVGSAEHKRLRWWGGLPAASIGEDGAARRPRKQLTTICPLTDETDRRQATKWVRAAIGAGRLRFYEGDKDFPKHIWYRDEKGQLWFGFCVNGVLGQYKGWPIEEEDRVAVFG
jgi:hypothetical protein